MQRANKCDTNHIPKATAYSLVLREVLRRCGREVPQVGEERTCNAQQCREGCQLHRRAGRLASTVIDVFLTQHPSSPPEMRRASAEIPEAPGLSPTPRPGHSAESYALSNLFSTPSQSKRQSLPTPRCRGPPLLRRRRWRSSAQPQSRAGNSQRFSARTAMLR